MLCLHAPYISLQELISLSGLLLEALRISSLSLLHKTQMGVPKVLMADIGLPCQITESFIVSLSLGFLKILKSQMKKWYLVAVMTAVILIQKDDEACLPWW